MSRLGNYKNNSREKGQNFARKPNKLCLLPSKQLTLNRVDLSIIHESKFQRLRVCALRIILQYRPLLHNLPSSNHPLDMIHDHGLNPPTYTSPSRTATTACKPSHLFQRRSTDSGHYLLSTLSPQKAFDTLVGLAVPGHKLPCSSYLPLLLQKQPPLSPSNFVVFTTPIPTTSLNKVAACSLRTMYLSCTKLSCIVEHGTQANKESH